VGQRAPDQEFRGHTETVDLAEGIARTIAWQKEYYGVA